MKHVWHECNEEDCIVCNSNFAWCIVCGLTEGELTAECPGYKVSYEDRERCYGDEIDFVNGAWANKVKKSRIR